MSGIIKNRYEFMWFFDCENGNPNGDPDAGNSPRIDPQSMLGLVSDVAIKRRIRNYVQMAKNNEMPNAIFIEHATNLNKFIAKAHEETEGGLIKDNSSKDKVNLARDWMCKNFFDIRTFGAVLSTGANAGQVRGPVQIAFAKSYDPILPLDISITRMAVTENVKDAKSSLDYQKWEDGHKEDELRTMGRKNLIPYGLFGGKGFISAHLAKDTNFNEEDLSLLWESLLKMYDHDRSSSKGIMTVQEPLIIFKHIGTDSDEKQKEQQMMLGCAPAHKLFDLVSVEKIKGCDVPRKISDYSITINKDKIPNGIEVLFAFLGENGKLKITSDFNELPSCIIKK